jgi:23S rRNA (cytidine1920-2'-O)/16S rRNA (cytidine1409-2'-O)-methyltransferase
MDLSFISLSKVLVRAWSFLDTGGHLMALIKPQFECKKKEADLGRGIIKDELIHKRVLQDMIDFANQNLANSELFAQTESSPKGADGNLEFFLGWKKKD